jgi:diphthine-ammonia ligase
MSYIASWSGGKDSCFAFYQAIQSGYEIHNLVNFISKQYKRVSFHGTEDRIIQLQSQAIGVPLLQKETTGYDYEQRFREAVKSLLSSNTQGMVFGDIYLEEHKEWVERICADLGIRAIEPLWGKDTEEVLSGFIDKEFKAVIVSAQSKLIDREWIGRVVDKSFMSYLKSQGIDICGENGEYHTLVIDGPIFKAPIRLAETRTIERDGYWFLDTVEYKLDA